MNFSRFTSGISHRALMAPDGPGSSGPAEPLPAAMPAADAPAGPAAPAAPENAGAASEPAKPVEAAPAAAALQKEFAPSLLDEAPKPAADPAKPAEPAPLADAVKPDGDKPPAPKEPAAADAKPDPAKPLEAKPDPAKPAEPPAPIEYAFTYPEGISPKDVDAERMGAFTGTLQELRAAPEVGQKLLDLHLQEAQRIAQETEQRVSDRQWSVFQDQQKKAREEVMADPELGGSRHETAKRTIMSFVDSYLTRESTDGKPRSADAIAAEKKQLFDDFRATGIANRRSLLHLLHWAGDKFVREPSPRPAPPPRTPSLNPAQRGLRRYQGTTPASNGAA